MQEITTQVNWLVAVVGAIAAFVAGSLWYSPWVFDRRWADGLGFSLDGKPTLELVLAQIAGLGPLSLFIAVAGGSAMAVLLGLAAFLVLAYSGESFARQPSNVRLINAGYLLLAALIMLLTHALIWISAIATPFALPGMSHCGTMSAYGGEYTVDGCWCRGARVLFRRRACSVGA